jgi:hypothetical protein
MEKALVALLVSGVLLILSASLWLFEKSQTEREISRAMGIGLLRLSE